MVERSKDLLSPDRLIHNVYRNGKEMIVSMLPGLPCYGPPAIPFPREWGRLGREGTVAEFSSESGTWVGNFQPGLWGIDFVGEHPDGQRAVVISSGDLWIVDPQTRTAENILPVIDWSIEVQDPKGWIFSRQSIAFARLGPSGMIWHTRRLSWDGFDQLNLSDKELSGLAWLPVYEVDEWLPFRVDIKTGASEGGSFGDDDLENWEQLAQ
jgi:hypothetical protein